MADRLNKKFRKILRLSSRRRSVRPSPGEQATDVASAVTQAPRRSRNGTVYSTLLDIPPETLNTITEMLSLHDKARLLATCKAMKSYIEPQLWCRIKTRIGTSQDTAGLVGLLTDRPDIVPLIKALVLNEYHPCHTRRLLSFEMPELWCLLIQHEAESVEHIDEKEKRALNHGLIEQPKLTTFKFACS